MTVLLSVVPPGTMVKKGQEIAEFDRESMLRRIDDYQASVNQAQADIRQLKADLAVTKEAHDQSIRVAKADLDKARLDLKTLEVVSDIDAERLKLAAEETDARYKQLLKEVKLLETSQSSDLRAAEIEYDQTKLELQRAQMNADRLLVKAPMEGMTVMTSIRRGGEMAQVSAGDQIYPGQMFMQIVDLSSMVLNAKVNQVDSEVLRLGMKAKIRIDAYPGVEFTGAIYSIGAVPVAGRRPAYMKEIPVKLKLDQIDSRIIPDLSASADVVLDFEPESTLIPITAVFGDRESASPFVYLKTPSGWVRKPVELGLRNNLRVAVRSGVSKGDIVALALPRKPEGGGPPTS